MRPGAPVTVAKGLNRKGVSLIAAVFILTIMAFMGVIFVTLVSTGSLMSVNDMQSAEALYLAEGGLEYEQRILAQNLEWYRSADPLDTTTGALGAGSFTATTNLPATCLRRRLRSTDVTATVYTTARFPTSGYVMVEDDITGTAEFIRYTGTTAATLTGLTRGQTIGTVSNPAATHARGSTVYPVATLVDALANSCSAPTTFRISANTKFLSAGIVNIDGEEIGYGGSSTAGGNMTLTGVQRCMGPTASAAHNAGQPVTPLAIGSVTGDLQSEVTSTGSAGGAVRVLKKTVMR